MRMNTVKDVSRQRSSRLASLARSRSGNTLAMMGISIIPLAGLIGGAVDMSRMYLTKTRLQQACDAGALAGRKVMGGGTWAYDNYAARDAANDFFDGNMKNGDYGTTDLSHEYTESAGKVTGSATAKVPMTLMKIFRQTTKTVSVTCATEMRLPNTDVMFVLDTTGSMGETLSGDNKTKIQGLRIAVKCFYEIVARLNSDAACEGGDPAGGTGSQVQIRFGFVPYSTNVNVGRLLPSNWFADRWTYQSREQTTVYGRPTSSSDSGGWYEDWETYEVSTQNSSQACTNQMPADTNPEPTADPTLVNNSWTDTTWRGSQPYAYKDFSAAYTARTKTCTITVRDRGFKRTSNYEMVSSTTAGAQPFKSWLYKPVSFDISPLKNGYGWNENITLPTGPNWTDQNVPWEGCIEERKTIRRSNYSPIESFKSEAIDLDIDRTPDGNVDTQWAPALGSIIYPRKETFSNSSAWTNNDKVTFTNYTGESFVCTTEGRKMQKWPDAGNFDDYVDTLEDGGNTYHDIGLLWGARLLSPTGIFRSENEFTPQGGEIERHMIFMTDGDACTENYNYEAYGLEWYDRRRVDPNAVPTDGCTTTGTITQQVNARTAALCEAVKNKNITLWVIWFGEKNTYIETTMKACASPNRFFSARNSAQLQTTFRQIADQISQLRLTV